MIEQAFIVFQSPFCSGFKRHLHCKSDLSDKWCGAKIQARHKDPLGSACKHDVCTLCPHDWFQNTITIHFSILVPGSSVFSRGLPPTGPPRENVWPDKIQSKTSNKHWKQKIPQGVKRPPCWGAGKGDALSFSRFLFVLVDRFLIGPKAFSGGSEGVGAPTKNGAPRNNCMEIRIIV